MAVCILLSHFVFLYVHGSCWWPILSPTLWTPFGIIADFLHQTAPLVVVDPSWESKITSFLKIRWNRKARIRGGGGGGGGSPLPKNPLEVSSFVFKISSMRSCEHVFQGNRSRPCFIACDSVHSTFNIQHASIWSLQSTQDRVTGDLKASTLVCN